MWTTVLFDLDGTLTDSGEGIKKCVQYALEKLGKPALDEDELNAFIGPPLIESFMRYAHMDEGEAKEAVTAYRERYTKTGMYENRLYPWVLKLLELFWRKGITMGVASSKPETYVIEILKYFGIDNYFKVIVGSELDGTRVDKKEVIEEAIHRLHMEDRKNEIVLVGDRKYDVIGADEADIACIGVTYGYGSEEELREANPSAIATGVADVAERIWYHNHKIQKESVAHKIWRIVYPIGIFYVARIVVQSIWSLVYMMIQLVAYGNTDVTDITQKLANHGTWITAVAALACIFPFLTIYQRDNIRRQDLGVKSRIMKRKDFGVLQMILVALLGIVFSNVITRGMYMIGIASMTDSYVQNLLGAYINYNVVLRILAVGILIPIAEELVFRGMVYRRIRDYLNVSWAIVLSAAAFGIYHGNLTQGVFAFFMGILMAVVYERYQTLWAPILIHMAINCYSEISNAMGNRIVYQGTQAFILLGVGIIASAIMFLIIYWRKIVRK